MESQRLANPMTWWKWFKFSGLCKESVTQGKQNNHLSWSYYLSFMFLLYPGENASKQGRKVHAVYIFLIIVYRKKGGLVASQYTVAEGKLDANVDTITNEVHMLSVQETWWIYLAFNFKWLLQTTITYTCNVNRDMLKTNMKAGTNLMQNGCQSKRHNRTYLA